MESVLKKCTKLIRFFKMSHQANFYLKQKISESMVEGSSLKNYCKIKWIIAWNCIASILKCKNVLKDISINNLFNILIN